MKNDKKQKDNSSYRAEVNCYEGYTDYTVWRHGSFYTSGTSRGNADSVIDSLTGVGRVPYENIKVNIIY
ncbi:hypothetical protein P4I85_29240 [Bacillus cereus]|uniref:hypothetical protein n=1 Tax=Bacillus thuringiensis TaxID=1428 RepID=UPI000A3B9CDA|nr:hypothetical protein [Bacillus thuringiensis]MDA2153058.1 hypothetical protein [Bacillus cereus]MDA2561860.1 hypothetical protein [Bacillus cereus]MDA2615977.1 hypothetical protein [Bacillus cereus]MEB9163945.1 hypothetical protein [Bacillus cereus]MEB9512804.1 hypothetical protein [Bacillus cereus]